MTSVQSAVSLAPKKGPAQFATAQLNTAGHGLRFIDGRPHLVGTIGRSTTVSITREPGLKISAVSSRADGTSVTTPRRDMTRVEVEGLSIALARLISGAASPEPGLVAFKLSATREARAFSKK